MSLYVGINNTPKKITNLLVGNNGGATQIGSAYTGGLIQRIRYTRVLI